MLDESSVLVIVTILEGGRTRELPLWCGDSPILVNKQPSHPGSYIDAVALLPARRGILRIIDGTVLETYVARASRDTRNTADRGTALGVVGAKLIYERIMLRAAPYHSVNFDPTRRGNVYLGAFAGLYRSIDGGKTFAAIPAPPGIASAGCSGATVTPDGRFVLATFGPTEGSRFRGGTRLYAAPTDGINAAGAWQELSEGLFFPPGGGNQYWNPRVDPRSLRTDYGLAGTYKVLLAFLNGPVGALAGQQGLHEGTFSVEASGRLAGKFRRIFGKPSASPEFTFDLGWNDIGPQNRQNTYLPVSWDSAPLPPHLAALGDSRSRKVYVTNNQQLYLGNPDDPLRSWVVLSNRYVRTLNGHRFYRTPGFASTVTPDFPPAGCPAPPIPTS